jgi:hypothetical protein
MSTDRELRERYNEFLNEMYGQVSVAGYYYDTAYLLKEADPTAYEIGFDDYLDMIGYEEQP